MPLKSSDFYRMTKERTPGTDAINVHGNWASPCCGREWRWGFGAGRRVFSIQEENGGWLLGYIGTAGAGEEQ
eukprot:11179048-Lingulodinium_polyedra.AAC.1